MAMNGVTSTWGPEKNEDIPHSLTFKVVNDSEFPDTFDCVCPRCGEEHKNLETKKLHCSSGMVSACFPRYAVCPKTNEPIILIRCVYKNYIVGVPGEQKIQAKSVDEDKQWGVS